MARKVKSSVKKVKKDEGQKIKVSPSLVRFRDELINAGLDDESVGFLLGRLARRVNEEVMGKVVKVVGEEELKKIGKLSQEERVRKLDEVFLAKKKKSLAQFQEDVTDRIVRDFEAQK